MICIKCGAINDNNSNRCKSCQALLQESPKTAQYSQKVFQSPLRQARPSNIITANAPSYSQQVKTEGPSMKHEQTQDQSAQDTYMPHEDPEIRDQTKPKSNTQVKVLGGSKSKTILLTLFLTAALLSTAMMLYLYFSPRGTDASFLFAEAEKKFSNQNYAAALTLYRQFVEKFPEDHLMPLAQNRIKVINHQITFDKETKEHQIEGLLERAREAYRKQRYLRPEEDNVVFYTSQVLELDQSNSSAIELQALIIGYYETKAQQAAKRGYSRTAINHYRSILDVIPNDSTILAKIDSLESRRR